MSGDPLLIPFGDFEGHTNVFQYDYVWLNHGEWRQKTSAEEAVGEAWRALRRADLWTWEEARDAITVTRPTNCTESGKGGPHYGNACDHISVYFVKNANP